MKEFLVRKAWPAWGFLAGGWKEISKPTTTERGREVYFNLLRAKIHRDSSPKTRLGGGKID